MGVDEGNLQVIDVDVIHRMGVDEGNLQVVIDQM